MNKLTESQIEEIKLEETNKCIPVRFMADGVAYWITTGNHSEKGENVIYHPVYWNFTRETARKVANPTNTTAVFDKE